MVALPRVEAGCQTPPTALFRHLLECMKQIGVGVGRNLCDEFRSGESQTIVIRGAPYDG